MVITVAQLQARVTADTSDAESKLSGFGQKVDGLGGAAGKMATAAVLGFAAIGAGAAAGFGSAINSAADFEAVISEVAAVSGASADELQGLSALALQMGADTAFSASEAAQAMSELAKGGIEVADMAAVLPGTLDLAAAGGLGLAEAAVIATDTMAIFTKQGVKMDRVADAFAGAANISSISVQDMAESMKYVGPVAANFGLTLEDTSAAIALLGANGVKSSQAGTGLRTMLLGLAAPTDKAKTLIADLGLEFFDSSGKMKDFAGISDELKGALAGMSDAQRAATLETLFGKEGMSAALAVMGEGENSIQAYTDKLAAANSAHATGVQMMDNFRGTFEQFKGAIETAAITLGLAFLPVLRRAVEGLTGGVNAVLPFVQAWGPRLAEGLGVAISALGQFAGGVGSAIGAVLGAFGQLINGQITFAQFVGGIQSMISVVIGNLGQLAAQAGPPLLAFFSAIGGFIATAAPQIAALMGQWAGAFVGWIGATAIPWLAPRLGEFLAAIGNWVGTTALPAIGGWLSTVGAAFGNWIGTTAIPWVQTNLPLWLSAVGTWITATALPAIGGFLGMVGTAFGNWVTERAIPWVGEKLPQWQAAIGEWITNTALPAIGTALGDVGTAFGDWVTAKAVPWVEQNLPEWQRAITNWVTGTAVPAIADAGGNLAEAMGSWIRDKAIPFIENDLPAWGGAILVWIDSVAAPEIKKTSDRLGEAMSAWVREKAIPKVEADLPDWVAAVANAVNQANDIVEQGTNSLGEAMGNWVLDATPRVVALLAEHWQVVLLSMVSWPVALGQAAVPLTKAISDWAGDPARDELKGNLDRLSMAIEEWIIRSAFLLPILAWKMGEAIGRGLANGIKDTWPEVEGWFAALPGRIQAAVGDLSATLVNAGVNLISGLIRGVESQLGVLQALFGRITQSIPSWKGPPERDAILLFESGRLIMQGLIDGIDEKQADLIKKLTDVTNSIFTTIKNGVESMRLLADFDPLADTPGADQLDALTRFVRDATARMSALAAEFSEKGLEATGKFAETSGRIVGLIGDALDAFAALSDYVAIPTLAIYDFGKTLRSAINDLALVAEQVTQGSADAAGAFATGVAPAIEVIGKGVDAFAALAEFVGVPSAVIYAFGKALRSAINDLALVAEQVTQGSTDAAALLAGGAVAVVGMIGDGVAAFRDLADFGGIPSSAIYAFGKALRSAINDLALVAEQVTQESTDAAAIFADGAGAVVALLGNAVEGLTSLLDFVAPGQAAIDAFAYAIRAMVAKFADLAGTIGVDGLDAAAALGVAAASVFDAVGKALGVFAGMADLVIPSAQAIDDVAIGVGYVVLRMGRMAGEIGGDGIAAARAFGDSVNGVFGGLKSAMDTLTNLRKFRNLAAEAFDVLLAGMQDAIERAQGMVTFAKNLVLEAEEYLANMTKAASLFEKGMALGGVPTGVEAGRSLGEAVAAGAREALDSHSPSRVMASVGRDVVAGLVLGMSADEQDAARQAAEVASAVAKAITDTLGAMDALAGLDVADLPTLAQVGAVLDFARSVAGAVGAAAATIEGDALDAAAAYAEAAGKVVAFVGGATEAMAALLTFVAPTEASIHTFGSALRVVVGDLIFLSDEIGGDLVEVAAVWAQGVGRALEGVGKAVAGLDALRGYARVASSAIYAFGKDARVAIWDLIDLGSQFAGDLATFAADFGERAGKALGVIATGAEGFDALREYARVGDAAIFAFGKDVRAAINDLALVADLVGIDMADIAGRFADGAGKVLGIVGGGVAAFRDLDGYTGTGEAAILAFVASVAVLVGGIATAAERFTGDGLALAGLFAEAAAKALGVIGGGVRGFVDIATFVAPSKLAMDAFIGTVEYVVGAFGVIAARLNAEGIKAAGDFGAAAAAVLGATKAGIDAFRGFTDMTLPLDSGVDALMRSTEYVVNQFDMAARKMGSEGLQRAGQYASVTAATFGAIKSALDVMGGIVANRDAPTTWLDSLLDGMAGAISRAGEMVRSALTLREYADDFFYAMQQAAGLFAGGLALSNATAYAGDGTTFLAPQSGGVPLQLAASGGGGRVVNINIEGPIYGFDDFKRRVQEAKLALEQEGVWR